MANYWHAKHRRLSKGDRGPDVEELQKALADQLLLNPELVADGVFGHRTKDAVEKFQKDKGLIADGIVGPLTHAVTFGGNYRFAPAFPPAVRQGNMWTCWAACLASLLGKSWAGRKEATTKDLLTKYGSQTGNKGSIDPKDFVALGAKFKYRDITSYFSWDARLYAERLVRLLNARRPLILTKLSPIGGVGHAMVIYGVSVQQGHIFVMLMDPMHGHIETSLTRLQASHLMHFVIFAANEVPL